MSCNSVAVTKLKFTAKISVKDLQAVLAQEDGVVNITVLENTVYFTRFSFRVFMTLDGGNLMAVGLEESFLSDIGRRAEKLAQKAAQSKTVKAVEKIGEVVERTTVGGTIRLKVRV